MTPVQKRIVKLKALGVGDDECRQCLEISIVQMSCCRKCIAHTPAFNSAMQAIAMTNERRVWDLA